MNREEILERVKYHHQRVEELGYMVVMTVLIGSQNYSLDVETSDIDTFSLTLPSVWELSKAKEAAAGEFELEDGKCMYKDIRVALNLLKKTSPNSVELFTSKYMYFNPLFEGILEIWLTPDNMKYAVHCNYSHMLYACAGMAHQLTKRNMPAGKRYSHALRLKSMAKTFLSYLDVEHILDLWPQFLSEARAAKRDKDNEEYYNSECERIEEQLLEIRNEFTITEKVSNIEHMGMSLIENFQKELMYYYIKYIL